MDAAGAPPSSIVEGTAVNLIVTALEVAAAQLIAAQRGAAGVGPARGALAGFGTVGSMRSF
jgi:hypothetical protein